MRVRSTRLKNFGKDLGFVFLDLQMRPIDYGHIYRDFKHAQKRAGMTKPLAFHDLRHTFASLFMMNGRNLFDLQKILGHTDMKMTQRYAHFSPEHLQSAIGFMSMGVELEGPNLKSCPIPNPRDENEDFEKVVMLG